MTFFPSLERKDFPRGRAQNSKPMTAQYSRGFGFPVYDMRWDLERIVRDGVERSIWVFRAVDAIAGNGASLPALLRKDDPENGEVHEPTAREDLRLLYLLNRRPNPYETARQFKYRLLTQFLLSKKGVFVEVVPSRGGGPAAFYLLPPDRTAPIPHKTRFIEGFELQHGDGEIQKLAPERVIWIRKPHPVDPYAGMTPAEAAGIEIDADFYMRLFNRNFMANDGRPGGMVGVSGQMAPDVRDELEARFNGAPEHAGRVTVVEADKISYSDFATSPREAQFVESRKVSKEDLLLAFGVPESVLGNASGRTFDNADSEYETFWRHTMREKLSFVYEAFDRLTAGGDDDDLFLAADYSGINVMQRDERERDARLAAAFAEGRITLDEYRDGVGRELLDVPESRVHWVAGQGKIPIAADEADEKAAVELLLSVNPQPAEPEGAGAAPAGGTRLPTPGRTPATRSEPPKLRAVKSLIAPGGSGPNGELLPTDMTDAERALFKSGRTPEDIAESRRAAAASRGA